MVDISVVIPVFGCPDAINELHDRLVTVLDNMNLSYEIIMVDDRDNMGSWDKMVALSESDTKTKIIRLTKNFGQGCAITAGINESNGKWIVTMDCDLQDKPEMLPDLYNKVREGYDVVFVRRKERKDSIITRIWACAFHKVFVKLSGVDYDFDLATYLIASERAAKAFLKSKDRGRDFGMYLMWLGYSHAFINMEQGERHSGKSSYTFLRKIKYAIGVITSFSNRLLYIPIYIGLIISVLSFLYLIFIFSLYFIERINPEGWTTIVMSIFMFGGLMLSTIGLLGIYIGNIFDMNKERPLYVIQEKHNFEGE